MLEKSVLEKLAGNVVASGLLTLGLVLGMSQLIHAQPSADELRSRFEPKTFQSPGASAIELKYCLSRPAKIEAQKTYPLVIFLHGAGERGSDNQAQLKHSVYEFARSDRQAAFPAFVVVPQCPKEQRWVEVDWSLKRGDGSFESAESPMLDAVMALVDQMIETQPIDPKRIYITGLSMGGYGTWYAAAKWPEKFAAAMPVCGGGDPTWAARYNGVPVWAIHGQEDTAVKVERSREMVSAIASAGHAPELRYTEYPGVAHDSWTQTYVRDDVMNWLFHQSR